jgi:hypothetical protein
MMNGTNISFKPGHRYLVVWNDDANNDDEQPFKIIQNKYGIHYGPRGENHFDFTKCPYLTTKEGIIFKFIYKRYERSMTWLNESEYENMAPHIDQIKLKLRNAELESGVSKRSGNRWYRLTFEKLKEVGDEIRNFCERTDYVKPNPEIKYIERVRDAERIKSAFEYFINKPEDTIFGFDYETAYQFPMEGPEFQVMGLGIASCDDDAVGVYFDVQWMIHKGRNNEYQIFLEYFNKFLDKFENSVTYNSQFEQKVTYILTKRLCLFDEGATINKCDGRVYKRFSLKYTAQCVLGVKSWDDDFDLLTGEWLPELFGWDEDSEVYKWKLVADGYNTIETGEVDEVNGTPIFKEVPNDYKHNPIWQKIVETWPEEESEFIDLIENNYGEVFACIPSNIQSQYCCRDSYYTGLLKIEALKKYSKLCYDTYNHNLQLEALLHLTGFFCNEDYRVKMELQSLWMEVYGKLNATRWALKQKLDWYKDLKIPYIPEVTELIKMGYDPCSSKPIIMNNLSETSESGLDEDKLRPILGDEVLQIYIDYIKEYCFRIDESYKRSRKVFSEINAELEERYKPDYGDSYCKYTIKGEEYVIELSWDMLNEYYSTKSNYDIITDLCSQLSFTNIEKFMLPQLGEYELPEKMYARQYGQKEFNRDNCDEYSLDDVLDICDSAFNYKSAKVSPYLKFMVFNKFKSVLYHAFSTDYEYFSKDSKPELSKELIDACAEKEFTVEWIDRQAHLIVNEDLERLKTTDSWKRYLLNHDMISLLYSGIMEETVWDEERQENVGLFQQTPTGDKDDKGRPIMGWSQQMDEWFDTVSTDLTGWFDFLLRYVGFWTLDDDAKEYFYKNIDNIDIEGDTIESLAKLNFCFTSAKKYNKVVTAYMRGEAFYTHNYDVQGFDENGVTPNLYEEKDIHKCYIPFYANQKKSKRWSSGYHTIPSKAEMKRIITTPPGFLLSYFDISGAEIRTISFMSKDPFMIDCYEKGLDPYITMARFTYPESEYDPSKHDDMDYEDYLRSWRGAFKSILLGLLYGMGIETLANNAEIDVETAEQVTVDLWERCPVLKQFVEEKSQWALDHIGYVQSALGDVLEMDEGDGEDRAARLGINQFIQNYASVSLADGFMNVIEISIHHRDEKLNSKDFILRPAGVVHDSCQIYFPTKYLFEMQDYYERTLSGYLYDLHKILYAFDLEVGTNYYDMIGLKSLDSTHIELSGNYTGINNMIEKCVADGLKFRIVSLKATPKHQDPIEIEVNGFEFGEQFQPKLPKSVIKQFFDNNCYACYNRDTSKFKCVIEKI